MGFQTGFPILGFVFWMGVFIWLFIIVWSRYLKDLERQKTLRMFAERGQPLDAETLEKLLPKASPASHRSGSPVSAERGLLIGGIVMTFIGLGLAIGAQIIGRIDDDALLAMSGAAAIVGCAGLGLITSSWVMRRQAAADRRALLDPADTTQ